MLYTLGKSGLGQMTTHQALIINFLDVFLGQFMFMLYSNKGQNFASRVRIERFCLKIVWGRRSREFIAVFQIKFFKKTLDLIQMLTSFE